MKKLSLILAVLLALVVSVPAIAADAVNWSTKTADAAITSGRVDFHGITVTPDGTNAVTVAIYDNTTGSGSKLAPSMTFAGNGGTQFYAPPYPKACLNGIYVDVTVAGGGTVEYTVDYEKR